MKKPRPEKKQLQEALQHWKQNAAGNRCLTPESLVEFYRQKLSADELEEIRDHLSECPACHELASDARGFLQAAGEPLQVQRSVSQRFPRRYLAAALLVLGIGGALLAMMTGNWLIKENRSFNLFQEQLVITKLPYPARPASEPGTPEEEILWRGNAREEGTARDREILVKTYQLYAEDQLPEAERQFAEFLKAHPDWEEAQLYHGVTLLLLKRFAEAVIPLQKAREGKARFLQQEASWYLALAYLKIGDLARAQAILEQVAKDDPKHGGEAKKLLENIELFLKRKISSSVELHQIEALLKEGSISLSKGTIPPLF